MGKKGIVGKIDDWLDKNRAEYELLLSGYLDEGEELEGWILTKTAPAEILDWIPLLNIIYGMKTRLWVLVLTPDRMLRLRRSKFSIKNLTEVDSIPIANIQRMDIKNGPLFSDLFITSRGGRVQYKEMDKDEVMEFMTVFKGFKKAVKKRGRTQ